MSRQAVRAALINARTLSSRLVLVRCFQTAQIQRILLSKTGMGGHWIMLGLNTILPTSVIRYPSR